MKGELNYRDGAWFVRTICDDATPHIYRLSTESEYYQGFGIIEGTEVEFTVEIDFLEEFTIHWAVLKDSAEKETKNRKLSYKENTYTHQGECEFKNPETRNWVKAIRYTSEDGKEYIREIEEFNKLFKEI
jgi:hypothetical protein